MLSAANAKQTTFSTPIASSPSSFIRISLMQIPIKMVNMPIRYPVLCVAGLLAARLLSAQAAKPEPDVLLLTDGERLVGHFEQSDGSSVKFKSDVLGSVTVDWSKVKELHTPQTFAVIPKNVELKKNA